MASAVNEQDSTMLEQPTVMAAADNDKDSIMLEKPTVTATVDESDSMMLEEEQLTTAVAMDEQDCTTTNISMLEQLTPELMVKILLFSDVRDRMQLAGSSTALHKRVCRECPQAWHIISFLPVMPVSRERLTDGELARLLTKVNAKQVTKKLLLNGCKNIHGAGLSPLRSSPFLEHVALFRTRAKENLTPFLWVLQTLLPYKLSVLRVDYSLFATTDPNNAELMDFIRKLREAVLERAQETSCSCCEQPVVDASRQVVPNIWGPPETFCTGCFQPFCKGTSCPMGVRECKYCHESFCDTCNVVDQCGFCGHSHCKAATCGGNFTSCETCGKLCCQDCEGGLVKCDYCKKRITCLECANYDVCTKDCTLCVVCQTKGNCSVCNGQFCIKCIERDVRQCHECRLVFCDKPACTSLVEHCQASVCGLVHCKACREFEYCITCEKSFCLQHDRLVDCFKCGMRHCRRCGYQRQCEYCNRACYEDCFCAERHPAKKAKTSELVTQK